MNRNLGFFMLMILAIVSFLVGHKEIGCAYFIAALFYEAIKQ